MKKSTIILFSMLFSIGIIMGALSKSTTTKEDISAIDGYVKFYLSLSQSSARAAMGILPQSIPEGSIVLVNGESYDIQTDAEGKKYINVKENADSTYNAVFMTSTSANYYDNAGIKNVRLLHSQFYRKSLNTFKTYPMYASYSKETGNELSFTDGFAVIDVAIKGKKENLKSIVIENPAGNNIAGIGTYSFEKKNFTMNSGAPYISYNCTNEGTPVVISYERHFYIPIVATEYPKGLKVRISDMAYKMMEVNVDEKSLEPNQVLSINVQYAPEENLVFYEGFDNFVWGGDYVAGSLKGKRYSPNATAPALEATKDFSGYENATTLVASTTPGTGYIQSNTWSDVNGYNVKKSHVTSDSYITSRGVTDYGYLFRCQEFSGYIGVGCASTTRGIFQTPNFSELKDLCNITIEFDVAFMANFNDKFEAMVNNGGNIDKVFIDNKEITLTKDNCYYSGIASHFVAPSTYFKISTSATAEKTWHHIKLEVNNASDGTNLYLEGNTTSAGRHGFYVDNIKVCKNGSKPLERGKLRLLYWNIQNGMWADQGNNYTNFVAWVKKYDPDICVWCESRSNYVTGSSTSLSTSASYLPNKYSSSDTNAGWAELAKRYGHNYAALGGHRDNFPQEVTSKYPITTILKITDTDDKAKPIAHGAAIQQVDVNGTKLNFITLHTWPQKYGYGVATADQTQSADNGEGNLYRAYEMRYILNHTYLDSKYKDFSNWIMLGDFNAQSIKDNFYYGAAIDDSRFFCHNEILNNTDLIDVIAERYPGQFMSSTHGSSRIDYVYTSPDIYSHITNAFIIKDNWTTTEFTGISNFYLPSDHRPILVDFDISPTGIHATPVRDTNAKEAAVYDLMGRKTNTVQKGVSIIKYSDGTTRKVIRK